MPMQKYLALEKALTSPAIEPSEVSIGDTVKIVPKKWKESVYIQVLRKDKSSVYGKPLHAANGSKYNREFRVKRGEIISADQSTCVLL